jgi:hypothetical protein
MNKDIAICTVAFGERYIEQQNRLIESLEQAQPGASKGRGLLVWGNQYPAKSPSFEQSLYGFKVYAISEAIYRGFKKIIWIDTACIVHGPLDYLFADDMPPVVAVKDDSKLINTIGDKALKYYGNPDISGLNLVGGSLYAFDFNKEGSVQVFDDWANAEADGMFGTMQEQISEQINKHRHDESCMAMALHVNNILPVTPAKARYCSGPESAVTKHHFK